MKKHLLISTIAIVLMLGCIFLLAACSGTAQVGDDNIIHVEEKEKLPVSEGGNVEYLVGEDGDKNYSDEKLQNGVLQGQVIEAAHINYTLNTAEDGYIVVGCDDSSEINIPDTHDGLPVVTIASNAFKNKNNLRKITIGANIKFIENSAFYNCLNLTEINFNATSCNDLSSGNNVFSYAGQSGSGITVNIGNNVTKIPAYLFYPTSSSGSSPKIKSVVFAENSVCESIGRSVFYSCTRLTSITIPDSVTSIGSYAFYGCSGLTRITIGRGVTSLGNSAFMGCTALTEINFNAIACEDLSGGYYVDENNQEQWDNNYVFYNAGQSGDGITVNIGSDVTKLPAYLFRPISSSSTKITSVVFAENSVCASIDSGVFYGCAELTSITLPVSVTSIGDYAFYDCSGLTAVYYKGSIADWCNIGFSSEYSNPLRYAHNLYINNNKVTVIEIPNTATKIGNYQFYGWNGTSITIPNSVTSIGNWAFYSCTGLTSVTIGNRVTSIGGSAFSGCTGLTSITIPNSVTSIGSSAFGSCSSLASVTIGNRVTNIGSSAFNGCSSLTSITISDSVTSIGDSAFYNCSSLTSATIGDRVTSIGGSAFYNCSSLTSVTIGRRVTSIGVNAFYNCTALTEINFNATACDDLSVTNNTDSNNVFSNAGQSGSGITLNIGNNVTKIPAYLFYPKYNDSSASPKIKNVKISDGVTSIGSYAFYNCSSLTSVTIGTGVTSIGNYAFYNCTGIKNITYKAIACDDLSSGNNVFYKAGNDNGLLKIYLWIGEDVVKIPAYLFCPTTNTADSPEIGSVQFLEGSVCESIGTYAFGYCYKITSLQIPDSIKRIDSYAFSNCKNSTATNTKLYYKGTISDWCNIKFGNSTANPLYFLHDLYINNNKVTVIDIPDTVTDIGIYQFYGWSGTTITIPDSVTIVSTGAFDNCDNLTYNKYNNGCYLGNTNHPYLCLIKTETKDITSFTINEGCKFIYSSAFKDCSSLTSITIPDEVMRIGQYAFQNCSSLTSVTIGSGVTSISSSAFKDCSSLTSITIPDSVTSIGNYAFQNCSSLTSINIPDGVKSIGNYAFQNCSSLTSVTIPDSVTSIGNYAFSGCTGLTSINIPDGVTSIGNYAFQNCSSLTSINIPDGVKSIGDYAFYSCSGLTEINYNARQVVMGTDVFSYSGSSDPGLTVNIGRAVEIIPAYMFKGVSTLTKVTFAEGSVCTIIGAFAFYNCSGLTSLAIPDNISTIGNDAFLSCDNITKVSMPLRIVRDFPIKNMIEIVLTSGDTIKESTFFGCDKLEKITLPSNLKSIGNSAFAGCTSLVEITFNATDCYNLAYGNNVFSDAGIDGEGVTVIIGSGVKSIPAYLFGGSPNNNITSVVFAENSECERIGIDAFRSCENVTAVYYNDDIENWYGIGFDNVYSSPLVNGAYLYIRGEILDEIVIPDSVTEIRDYQFLGWAVSSLTIPSQITSIGNYAFYNCKNLTVIRFNAVNCKGLEKNNNAFSLAGSAKPYITVVVGSGVTNIPDYLFGGTPQADLTPNITSFSFESGSQCVGIGKFAFSNCTKLGIITIPSSIKNIGDYAFYNCTGARLVNFNATDCNDLSEINYTFCNIGQANSSGLSVVIADNVTNIPAYLFRGNNKITKVTIGKSVRSIGDCAFFDCQYITEINYNARSCKDFESGSGNYKCLFYNAGKANSGITLKIGEDVTKLPSNLFGDSNGPKITTIRFSQNGVCQSIGEKTFKDCSNLRTVILGSSVTRIDEYAFDYCRRLDTVYYLGSVSDRASIAISGRNTDLSNATWYYYSDSNPYDSDPQDPNLYWGYVDGAIRVWERPTE